MKVDLWASADVGWRTLRQFQIQFVSLLCYRLWKPKTEPQHTRKRRNSLWRQQAFTNLRALSKPSTLLGGCSFSTLMQPFIWKRRRRRRWWNQAWNQKVRLCLSLSYVYVGGLNKSSGRVNVVVEDDHADHHTKAEQHGLLAGEATAILPDRIKTHRVMMRVQADGKEGDDAFANTPGLTVFPASLCTRRPSCSNSLLCFQSAHLDSEHRDNKVSFKASWFIFITRKEMVISILWLFLKYRRC